MPVRKLRILIEASRPEKLEPGTREFSLALHNVFRLAEIFAPPKAFPPGAYKFRSIKQAQIQKRPGSTTASFHKSHNMPLNIIIPLLI